MGRAEGSSRENRCRRSVTFFVKLDADLRSVKPRERRGAGAAGPLAASPHLAGLVGTL